MCICSIVLMNFSCWLFYFYFFISSVSIVASSKILFFSSNGTLAIAVRVWCHCYWIMSPADKVQLPSDFENGFTLHRSWGTQMLQHLRLAHHRIEEERVEGGGGGMLREKNSYISYVLLGHCSRSINSCVMRTMFDSKCMVCLFMCYFVLCHHNYCFRLFNQIAQEDINGFSFTINGITT